MRAVRGLFAEGQTIVREPVRSRDHTEIALREFGADIKAIKGVITLEGRPTLTGRELIVPKRPFLGRLLPVAGYWCPGRIW